MQLSSPLSLLVVDDEPDLCEMLSFEFTSKGHRVTSALDGQRAMAILESEPVDVVISDLRMPHLDGYELLDRIKTRNVHAPIVVLISAYADVAPEEPYHLGAEALFAKPFRLSDLSQRIHELLVHPEQRWTAPAERIQAQPITLSIADLESGQRDRQLTLGRGGMALSARSPLPFPEQRVAFDVRIAAGPLQRLVGSGVVRWVRAEADLSHLCVCGIEFEHLEEDSRTAFLRWSREKTCRPYIPNLVNES